MSTELDGATTARPMRVLYLGHTARPSGAELALARLLGAIDRARVEPIVVLGEDGDLRKLLDARGIETHVMTLGAAITAVRKDTLGAAGLLAQVGSLGRVLHYSRRIARFARSRDVDLIYTNTLKADLYGAIASKLASIPLIWHIHDRIDEGYLPAPAAQLLRWGARTLPACVVVNSASTLATLRLPQYVASAVITSGLEADFVDRCTQPRVPQPVPTVGIIGRISPWKGQDVFLRAAALVLRREIPVRFRIVGAPLFGEEDYLGRLQDLARDLRITEDVEFVGFSDVPTVLRSLDILVHASTSPEPFGQVIVEGLAAGLPVIASDGGGAREIIEHDRTGLLTPMGDADALADALARLLIVPEHARALAAAGRAHALANFMVEKSARQSEALYQRLLQPQDRPFAAVTSL